MNNRYITMVASLLLAGTMTVSAQSTLQGAYFSENSVTRHELNPAFTPERSYFSLPMLGGVNIGMHSNIGIDQILRPDGHGGLRTFMHPDESASFLNDLSVNNRLGASVNASLLGVGFRAFGGFNTIGVSLRSNTYTCLPKGLFEFMKLGQQGSSTTYSFDNLGLESENYVEIALGHQHKVNDHWSVGGKLKFLLGAGYANMAVDHMGMTMGDDKWVVNANGEMNMAVKGLYLPTNAEAGNTKAGRPGYNNSFAIDELDVDGAGLNGFGMALDLGVDYKAEFADGLELSLAVLDFGFINYGNNVYGSMNNSESWEFDGFHICTDESGHNHPAGDKYRPFEDQAEDLGNELADYLNFKRGSKSSYSHMLAATINFGASYKMPFYKGLKVGFLSSTRINGPYTWSEGRFSANVNPVKGLDLGINYAISSWGSSFGWLVNYSTTGFSMYLGMDHTLGDVAKQFVPLSGNANVAFGIVFPLTARK